MKKVLLLSSVIIILGLTGCSNKYFNDWFSSEQNETDKMCQQIIAVSYTHLTLPTTSRV